MRFIEVLFAEGGASIGVALKALGGLAMMDYMIAHPAITLGAAAVVVYSVIAAVRKSPPSP